jgi:hypothetical protein
VPRPQFGFAEQKTALSLSLPRKRESSRETALRGASLDSRLRGHDEKKSFREMFRPLKSLKTAKSRDFRAQQYQEFSKTRDFAGEAISFRFGGFPFRASSESYFATGEARRAGRAKGLEIRKSVLQPS